MTKWWIIGAAAVLGALLIGSIVLALLSKETEFEPGTPEHAVQTLLRAAEDDDIETAYAMLSRKIQATCTLEDFIDSSGFRYDYERDIQVTLREVKLVSGTTFITVEITQFYGSGPFDTSESKFSQNFTLQQEGEEWKFTKYPWPYDYCDETD